MALAAIITAAVLATLPEPVKKEYVDAGNGNFKLDVSAVEGFELADTSKLKSALQKEREASKKATDLLKTFEGIDPDKARDAQTQLEELLKVDPEKKLEAHKKTIEQQLNTKYDAERKKLTDQHTSQMSSLTGENKTLDEQLQQVLIQSTALSAITTAKGNPDLLLPLVKQQARLKKDDKGRRVVEIIDADGTVRLSSKAGSMDPMSIDEFVEAMKTDKRYSAAFAGAGASGSGAGAGDRGSGTGNSRFQLTETQAKDPTMYQRVRGEAIKAGQQVSIVPG